MVALGDRRIMLVPQTDGMDDAGGNIKVKGTPMEAWAVRRDRGGRESFLGGGGEIFGGDWTRDYTFPGEPYAGLNEDWLIVDENGVELKIDSVDEAPQAPRTLVVVRCHRETA